MFLSNQVMILFTIICALIGSVTAIIDRNCTQGGVYAYSATACSNVYSDELCNSYFGSPVSPGSSLERHKSCFSNGNGLSENYKATAIAMCPKTCGYCCQTKAYTCDNVQKPQFTCSSVTDAKCLDTNWRQIMANYCPNMCGFCGQEGCVDISLHCSPDLCVTQGWYFFTKSNCRRTCGFCDVDCQAVDTLYNCAELLGTGFCNSPNYTLAQKKRYCAKTCGFCSQTPIPV